MAHHPLMLLLLTRAIGFHSISPSWLDATLNLRVWAATQLPLLGQMAFRGDGRNCQTGSHNRDNTVVIIGMNCNGLTGSCVLQLRLFLLCAQAKSYQAIARMCAA